MDRRRSVLPFLVAGAVGALTVTITVAGVAPTAAAAQGETRLETPRGPKGALRRPGGPHLDRVLERHADRLGLDPATRAEIREVAEAGRSEARPFEEQLRMLRGEMRDLLDQETPDEQAVMTQAERIGQVETALQKQRLRTMLEIRARLSPEQRGELVKIHEEMRDRRGRRPRAAWEEPGRGRPWRTDPPAEVP